MILAVVGAALLAAVPAVADPITSKRAEARRVLAEIQDIDAQLGHAIEAYNGATLRLDGIRRDLKVNRRELGVARHNLGEAQRRLGARLRDLYVSGPEASSLEVILGATSLDDLITRIDTVNRVSDQDAQVLREVKRFRKEVERRGVVLRRAHAEQGRVVAQRAATKAWIERKLAERQQRLASIKDEIVRLQAEEARRQRLLVFQARARLSAQREAQQAEIEAAVLGAGAFSPEGDVVLPPARYGGVVAIAMQYLGIPYRWGGSSPGSGFDCSGFTMYVFAQLGVSLPHHAATQFGYGSPVPKDQLQAGDLVFFNGLGHMGIYIGDGYFIHAPHTGDVVKISSLNEVSYLRTYMGAKRLL